MKHAQMKTSRLWLGFPLVALMLFGLHNTASFAAAVHKAFDTPEAAVSALIAEAKNNGVDGVVSVIGAETREWLTSGDEVQDTAALNDFLDAFDRKHAIEATAEDEAVLVVGNDDFPFPFPVVKTQAGWVFDPERGKSELLNRRIGENELTVIQVLLAIVEAQREYAAVDWDGDGLLEYASKLRSSDGRRDGLYWPTGDDEQPSPMGGLVAAAEREGYRLQKAPDAEPAPFNGYLFKVLTRQGEAAPNGAREYVFDGRMIGGFAVLAYPARYGNSGIMTFMVNQDGTVYDADLGPQTAEEVQSIEAFDPVDGWEKVKID